MICIVLLICRCNVVINFFENAHKVSVSEESCDDCGANLLEVDFSKVMPAAVVVHWLDCIFYLSGHSKTDVTSLFVSRSLHFVNTNMYVIKN